MNHSTMIHIEEGDEIEVTSGNALGAASNYGVVTIGDDVTIFPRSAETCDKLIQALTEAREHFEHARPLGVPDIKPDGMEATRAAQRAILDERDQS